MLRTRFCDGRALGIAFRRYESRSMTPIPNKMTQSARKVKNDFNADILLLISGNSRFLKLHGLTRAEIVFLKLAPLRWNCLPYTEIVYLKLTMSTLLWICLPCNCPQSASSVNFFKKNPVQILAKAVKSGFYTYVRCDGHVLMLICRRRRRKTGHHIMTFIDERCNKMATRKENVAGVLSISAAVWWLKDILKSGCPKVISIPRRTEGCSELRFAQ